MFTKEEADALVQIADAGVRHLGVNVINNGLIDRVRSVMVKVQQNVSDGQPDPSEVVDFDEGTE